MGRKIMLRYDGLLIEINTANNIVETIQKESPLLFMDYNLHNQNMLLSYSNKIEYTKREYDTRNQIQYKTYELEIDNVIEAFSYNNRALIYRNDGYVYEWNPETNALERIDTYGKLQVDKLFVNWGRAYAISNGVIYMMIQGRFVKVEDAKGSKNKNRFVNEGKENILFAGAGEMVFFM